MTYRTKASTRGDVLGVFDQIKKLQLLQWSLAGGQPPGLRQNLHVTYNVVRDAVPLVSLVHLVNHYSWRGVMVPPWGRQNPLPGTSRPRRGRRGDDRSPGPSSPCGTCSGASLPQLWATSDVLLSEHKRKSLRNDSAAKRRLEGATDRFISDHGTDEGTGLRRAGTHSFCAALTEQTRHGGFICQAEFPLVLKKNTKSAEEEKKNKLPRTTQFWCLLLLKL